MRRIPWIEIVLIIAMGFALIVPPHANSQAQQTPPLPVPQIAH